jgi:hypothetical protein
MAYYHWFWFAVSNVQLPGPAQQVLFVVVSYLCQALDQDHVHPREALYMWVGTSGTLPSRLLLPAILHLISLIYAIV